MSTVSIPREQWGEFLQGFSERHAGWFARIETRDLETGEAVSTRYMPLESIALDTEDLKNHRINVTVDSDNNKLVKHVFFRPTRLMLDLSKGGADEALSFQSLNTFTTIRFRSPATLPLWERAG